MLIARTPLRISFAGGGTDLPSYYLEHGGLVLSATINKYIYSILTRRDDGLVQIISSDLRVVESRDELSKRQLSGSELEIPFAVLKFINFSGGANLFVASEIPPGTGLGSSAALSVNLLRLASAHLQMKLSRSELAEHAFEIARNLLGRPVGKQDEYAAAFGGLNLFHFNREGTVAERVPLPSELLFALERRLMLFFTGAAHDSTQILIDQDKAGARGESGYLRTMDDLKALVAPTRQSLERGDFEEFGRLLHEGWETKKRASSKISTGRIDSLYALARASGASGGKITGAGGGGFLLLCCEPERQTEVSQALVSQGCKQLFFQLESGGSHMVFDDPFFDPNQRGGIHWKMFAASA